MVPSGVGAVIILPFPFTDLSQNRIRPAAVLADAGRGDWVLCQITSNTYSDPLAVALSDDDFQTGGLNLVSYARPGKIFTANQSLFRSEVGSLTALSARRVLSAVVALLTPPHE